MARVKRGVTAHAKHKKVLKQARGFYGRRKNTIRTAKAAVDRSKQYAYRDRKVNKRNFRALWIQRINAAVREHGLTLEAAGSEQAQASETIDAHLHGEDTVVSLKPSFLLDGLGAVHSEFVRISFTKTENPNKPGPVLISGQKSKDDASSEEFRYLLQPNLLLR